MRWKQKTKKSTHTPSQSCADDSLLSSTACVCTNIIFKALQEGQKHPMSPGHLHKRSQKNMATKNNSSRILNQSACRAVSGGPSSTGIQSERRPISHGLATMSWVHSRDFLSFLRWICGSMPTWWTIFLQKRQLT